MMSDRYMTLDQLSITSREYTMGFLEKWQDEKRRRDTGIKEHLETMDDLRKRAAEWAAIYLAVTHMAESDLSVGGNE